jgi:hypothetical protein
MSPITDYEQVDELKERRRARQSRPGLKRGVPARIQFAEPARDLLGGLITGGSPEGDQDRPVETQDAADVAPEPAREATTETESRAEQAEAAAQVSGEKIDELIRRVKEGTPAEPDTATTIERRRPKGTVDLPPGAGPRRRNTHIRPSTPSRRRLSKPRRTRVLGIAATLAVAGTAVLVVTLSGGSSQLSPARSASSSGATTGSFAAFGGALSSMIAALGPELSPFARHAASAARTSRPRRTAARRRPARSHLKVARHTGRAARPTSRLVPASSTSTTTASQIQPQTYTPTPAPAPAATASQTPVSATHSTTSSNRSSGPTGSNPLGGIGSCVKGC